MPQSKIKNLFNTQKKCIRILFGDWNAYCDKFQTCVKARPIDLQKLGPQFYKKEHTKPLFKKFKILSAPNLYSYHCFLEVFKLLKFRTPIALHSLFKSSKRKEMLLNYPPNLSYLTTYSISYSATKSQIKNYYLIGNQNSHDDYEW